MWCSSLLYFKLTKFFAIENFSSAKDSGKVFIIIIYIILIIILFIKVVMLFLCGNI